MPVSTVFEEAVTYLQGESCPICDTQTLAPLYKLPASPVRLRYKGLHFTSGNKYLRVYMIYMKRKA
jgi:hypothetical protein